MIAARDERPILDRMRAYIFTWGRDEPTVNQLVEVAQAAEALGYAAVHVPWHYTMPRVRSFHDFGTRYSLDPMVVLPAIANGTSRIKIAFEFVAPVTHPFAWAHFISSLDRASNGRVLPIPVLGWWKEDFQVGGAKTTERGKRFDECLDALDKLWSGEGVSEPGRFWDVTGLELDPRPAQDPMPMWIGGGDLSIPRAAKYAEAFYPLAPTPDQVRELAPRLAEASEGRSPLELAVVNHGLVTEDADWLRDYRPNLLARINGLDLEEATARIDDPTLWQPQERLMVGDVDQCVTKMNDFIDAGVDHFVYDFNMHGWEDIAFGVHQMTRFAEDVAPRVAELRGVPVRGGR